MEVSPSTVKCDLASRARRDQAESSDEGPTRPFGPRGSRIARVRGARIREAGLAMVLALTMTACGWRRQARSNPGVAGPRNSAATSTSEANPSSGESSQNQGAIVTPATPKAGRISLVNGSARYVIVTFSVGQVPVRESRLHVYRDGLKVAELKVTDFVRDINAAADIVAGECQVGDEVRIP
jgi:hypothetical protein